MQKFLLRFFLILLLPFAAAEVHAQASEKIHTIEYFFNTDPGFGNGTAVTVTPAATTVPSLSFSPDISALPRGLHILYVRSVDSVYRRSQTVPRLFFKETVITNTAANITNAEYFFDTDPGFGNGTAAAVTPGGNVSFVFAGNIASLPAGFHMLYVRVKDALGNWSHTTQSVFYREVPVNNPTPNVVSAEYFFDTDPGFGNGVSATVTAAQNVTFNISPNIAALTNGLHWLYIRTTDANGNSSITTPQLFYKEPAVSSVTANITAAEYFFDTDPGFGNAISTPVVAGQNVTFNISGNIASLTNGLHYLHVRTRAADGKWSVTTPQLFYKEPAVSFPVPNVVAAEYFFDADPGFGNGTPYIFPTPGTSVTQLMNLSTTGLTKGFHRLYMRAKDANGNWSLINAPFFYYETIVGTAPVSELVYLEWFWNTDPGFGNANHVSLPSGNAGQITDFVFNPGGITTFSNTRQNLYVRMVSDHWSETTVRMVDFTGIVLPVTLLEFSARAQINTVLTRWTTTQELNSDRFEVEHSTDGVHFVKFGTLAAAGNSTVLKNYTLEHMKPVVGVNYYRLKQIDTDGSFTYSGVVKVIFNSGKSGPVAFPNPVTDKLTVMIPIQMALNNKVTLNVFDSKGALLFKRAAPGVTNNIDFTNYSSGNYFITLSDDTGRVVWKEAIIKQR